MIRIGLNVLVAPKVADNEKSLLRIIAAEEAVKIIKDITIVRTAEKQLQQL